MQQEPHPARSRYQVNVNQDFVRVSDCQES